MAANLLGAWLAPVWAHAARVAMVNKPDSTSKAICEGLRSIGAHVSQIASASGQSGVPDLLVSFRGAWHVLELKAPKGRLSPAQAKFHLDSRATVHVVRTVEESLRAIGALREDAG